MRKRLNNQETGAIAIDAVLGITVFLISMCTIMFISFLVRIEAKMQYAVNQTAKEISSYYYVLDAVGLAAKTSGVSDAKDQTNKILDGVIDLASTTGSTLSGMDIDPKDLMGTAQRISKDEATKDQLVQMYHQAQTLFADIKSTNPADLLRGALSACAHSFTNKMVAPFLCRMIMPKYIESDAAKLKQYYDTLGMKNGIDDIDFFRSSLLDDGRTIKIVAIYKVNIKNLSFGLVNYEMTFCKTAVTAACVRPTENGNLKSVADAYKERKEKAGVKETADDKKETAEDTQ